MRDFFARDSDEIAHLPGMKPDDEPYFRDLYDTLVRSSDLVDSYRDLLSGATDMYLSTVANRQGEISKQLTIIATIFLPLSFLTGFFGQNFTYLTGNVLNHTWSFFALGLGLLVASIAAALVLLSPARMAYPQLTAYATLALSTIRRSSAVRIGSSLTPSSIFPALQTPSTSASLRPRACESGSDTADGSTAISTMR